MADARSTSNHFQRMNQSKIVQEQDAFSMFLKFLPNDCNLPQFIHILTGIYSEFI